MSLMQYDGDDFSFLERFDQHRLHLLPHYSPRTPRLQADPPRLLLLAVPVPALERVPPPLVPRRILVLHPHELLPFVVLVRVGARSLVGLLEHRRPRFQTRPVAGALLLVEAVDGAVVAPAAFPPGPRSGRFGLGALVLTLEQLQLRQEDVLVFFERLGSKRKTSTTPNTRSTAHSPVFVVEVLSPLFFVLLDPLPLLRLLFGGRVYVFGTVGEVDRVQFPVVHGYDFRGVESLG
jgi:hypothetical protein